MKNNPIKGTRKIKFVDKTYKKGDQFLHPLTLNIVKVKTDKVTPTEPYFDTIKKKGKYVIEKDNINYSDYEIQKYMSLPYLNLNIDIMLSFYEIENIDTLNNIINYKIINNQPPKNIIRIINIWIKNNFNDLKNHNQYIYSLFKKINDKYYKLEHNKEKIIKFINNWINTKDINDFEFNLFEDIFRFIKS